MSQYDPRLTVNADVREYFEQVFGEEEFAKILKRLSFPSLKTTLRVNTTTSTPQDVLKELENEFPEFSPHLLDALPGVLQLQGVGPRVVHISEDVISKEVLTSRKTAESVLRGASVFAPGILASSPGLKADDIVSIYVSNEEQHYTRGSLLAPNECQNNTLLFIGIGRSLMSRTEMFRSHTGLAVTLTDPIFKSPCCNGLLIGKVMLQNLPSIVTAHVLAPRPGWRVLDMCAAPGGKATAIAEIMQNKGTVIALDRTHKKVKHIADLAEELKLTCISAYKMDATKALCHTIETSSPNNQPNLKDIARQLRKQTMRIKCKQEAISDSIEMQKINGFAPGSFDGVLLDAPCSALGLRPRLHFPHTFQELQETAQYQRRLLDAAVPLLKDDGVLVYSTCTINPMENEANVNYTLQKYPYLILEDQDPVLGRTGLTRSANGVFQWLSPDQAALIQRFDPSDFDLDTIGFFIAKFRKRGIIKH